MDSQKVDFFLISHGQFFPEENCMYIRERLIALPEDRWPLVSSMQFKNPTLLLILSLFMGNLGIDRFFIGDTEIGVGKLLTCGGLGVWTIIDWFLIMDATRRRNYTKLAVLL